MSGGTQWRSVMSGGTQWRLVQVLLGDGDVSWLTEEEVRLREVEVRLREVEVRLREVEVSHGTYQEWGSQGQG